VTQRTDLNLEFSVPKMFLLYTTQIKKSIAAFKAAIVAYLLYFLLSAGFMAIRQYDHNAKNQQDHYEDQKKGIKWGKNIMKHIHNVEKLFF